MPTRLAPRPPHTRLPRLYMTTTFQSRWGGNGGPDGASILPRAAAGGGPYSPRKPPSSVLALDLSKLSGLARPLLLTVSLTHGS